MGQGNQTTIDKRHLKIVGVFIIIMVALIIWGSIITAASSESKYTNSDLAILDMKDGKPVRLCVEETGVAVKEYNQCRTYRVCRLEGKSISQCMAVAKIKK